MPPDAQTPPAATLDDRTFESDERMFNAICDVWMFAVRTMLPDAERLRDELARLQEHTGLVSRGHIAEMHDGR